MRRTSQWANLDILRAIAVLLVLVAHVAVFFGLSERGPLNPRALGILGVLFFFVHTTLVLMMSLERQVAHTGRLRMFRVFMTRRAFRIYPLSLFVLVPIYLFQIPSSSLGHHSLAYSHPDPFGLVSNALLVQNLVNRPSVLGVMWSLPYEIQMYFLLPALFLFVRRAQTFAPLLLLWVVALLFALLQPKVARVPDFFLYVPCFLPGILAYWLSLRVRAVLPFVVLPVLLAVSAVAYMYFWRPGGEGIVPGMFTCLVLGILLPFITEIRNPHVARAAQWIAKYSYGIYLTHYFALWVAFMVLSSAAVAAQWLVFVTLLIVVPVALFHLVESPMIRVGNRVASRVAAPVPAVGEAASQPASAA